MKKNFTSFCAILVSVLLLAFMPAKAQKLGKLYGLASGGGDSAGGVLFNYDVAASSYTPDYPFSRGIITPEYSNLIQATDGNFYGVTVQGGTSNEGSIFKCTPSGTVTVLHSFTGYPDGNYPYGSIIQGSDGNLYGMTYGGGTNGYGCIFQCTLSGTVTVIAGFDNTNGSTPYGSLVQAANGTLYGMTSAGGSGGYGTIFKCTTSGTLTKLFDFTGTANGSTPYGNLIFGTDGKLYGMTSAGGANNDGSIFTCDTTGSLTKLVDFAGASNGNKPYGSLMQATDGNLYGMTSGGGSGGAGTVFQCTTTGTLTTLVNFSNNETPYGNLIQAADGNLYGMTSAGGTLNFGTLFQCTTTGTLTTLVNFYSYDDPEGSLIQATDGNLYGMTYGGGAAGAGTIFKCSTAGTFSVLYTMGTNVSGDLPQGSLIQANDGNLYGMTEYGGTYGYGTIFRYSQSGVMSVIFNFDSINGSNPYGGLLQGTDGNLYGMTYRGGTMNAGTIFKCTTSGTFTKLVDFNASNGESPNGNLIQGTDGNLYGMTEGGGTYGNGTIFQCTTAGVLTTLWNFDNTNSGEFPYGSLIQGSDGNLYGMTYGGGANSNGIIFKCSTTGTFADIHDFTSATDGANPNGSLVQATDGNLYGITSAGGATNDGTIFKCSTTGTFSTLVNLNSATTGNLAYGSLIQGSDSILYGMTPNAGPGYSGVLFKCTLAGVITPLYNFNSPTGYNPTYTSLLEVMSASIAVTTPGCTSQTLTAQVRGGGTGTYTYAWSGGGTNSSLSGITAAGTYTVSVTNLKGITVTASITLPAFIPISASINTSANPKCTGDANGSATVLAAGGMPGYTYAWNDGGSQTTATATGLAAGSYTVTVTDTNLCTATSTVTLTDPPQLTVSVTASTNPKCYASTDGTATITAGGGTGAYTYAWNDGASSTGISVNDLASNTYTVTVTDANACVATANVTLTAPPAITASISASTNALCTGDSNGSATVTAGGGTPGYTYSWNTTPVQTTANATILPAGNYTVSVSDANSCPAATATVTITDPAPVTATVSASSNPTCNGSSNGTAVVTAGGGTPGYTYSWNSTPVQTTDTATGLPAGTYTVTVTDANSCPVATSTVALTDPAVVAITTNTADSTSCNGCTDGAASVTITGGSKNVIVWKDSTASGYVVMGNHTSDTITHLGAGTYVCIVTDSCGETQSDTIRIGQPSVLGIQSLDANNGVTIYPSPNNGHFVIELKGEGYRALTIYDETGKKVYASLLNTSNANASIPVNMDMCADGIYFAQILTSKGTVNKKIVIQR